ncbi:MAG: hypothetical protein IPF98_02840 [Gemmatimonadetes bacterium]|nr:hypothetical protein [Gemmatimonadota bacterium]
MDSTDVAADGGTIAPTMQRVLSDAGRTALGRLRREAIQGQSVAKRAGNGDAGDEQL